MKQFDIQTTKEIDGNVFSIRPFAAFIASNISGDLAAVIAPLLLSAAPALAGDTALFDMNAADVAPMLANGMSTLSGDTVERLLKKLLTQHRNVTVEIYDESTGQMLPAQILTEDLANEVFCGSVDGMFILAAEVVAANFGNFFKKLADQSGNQESGVQPLIMRLVNMASSTQADSAT